VLADGTRTMVPQRMTEESAATGSELRDRGFAGPPPRGASDRAKRTVDGAQYMMFKQNPSTNDEEVTLVA
jgi:hypothetical protein